MDAGQPAKPVEQRVVKVQPRGGLGIALRRQVNIHSQHLFGGEARVHSEEVKQARCQEARDNEKRCAHTDLNANERLTQSS